MFRVGAVIQATGLVYEERFWPNLTSPHEAPNKEINPGFTPGSGQTLFRLSTHRHTQKVCHELFSFFFFFLLLCNRLPLSSLMTGCGSFQRPDLEKRCSSRDPFTNCAVIFSTYSCNIPQLAHLQWNRDQSDLPFVQLFFFLESHSILSFTIFIFTHSKYIIFIQDWFCKAQALCNTTILCIVIV